MADKYIMINDIIEEHNTRMYNLKKYYPFFVLAETTFTQYKSGKYEQLDMGYITMALLRFLIQENSFNERDITYDEYSAFMRELLMRDFVVSIDPDDMDDLISYIFDKIKYDGRAFEFSFYDPGIRQKKIGRVKLIDSHIVSGKVRYFITAEGIEFYLETKEVRDESKINIEQLLLEKMITGENFRGGIEVVRRINSEVTRLIAEKDEIVDMLSYDVFGGASAYEKYMQTVGKWFSEEQKLFAKNKALVDKAIAKAAFDNMNRANAEALSEISELELELKRTILKHGSLISSTMELQNICDNIISSAKLKKLRPAFDFNGWLQRLVEEDRPDKMFNILAPLFAPKTKKTFSIRSIDNILNLRSEAESATIREDRGSVDDAFRYEDEILDERISDNFGRMFFELMDQIQKWHKLNLKEYNGILEIKFGKEIYANRDYYAFLVHLAQKTEYDVGRILDKQETGLEEMAVAAIHKDDVERFNGLRFTLTFTDEEILIPFEDGEEGYVTNIIFQEKSQEVR